MYRFPNFPKKLLAVASVLAFSLVHAGEPVPVKVKTSHPRILVTQTEIDNLRSDLAMPARFPVDAGAISFTWLPQAAAPGEPSNATIPLFGTYNTDNNAFFIRHINSKDEPGKVAVQIALMKPGFEGYVAVASDLVAVGKPVRIGLKWNTNDGKVQVTVGNTVTDLKMKTNWKPTDQVYLFQGRPGETFTDFRIEDGAGRLLAERSEIDLALGNSWARFDLQLDGWRKGLDECGKFEKDHERCNVATGHRKTIVDTALYLVLAYRLTGNEKYFKDALEYADRLLDTPIGAGKEWSMGGRVGAMAYLYDWLYDRLDADPALRAKYLGRMATAIKDTVALTTANRGDDLSALICGSQPFFNTPERFGCDKTPVYKNWDRFGSPLQPSTSGNYLGGHHFSATGQTAMALLAIANEHRVVEPFLQTLHDHFTQGFMEARGAVSIDGGYHTGFAYASNGSDFLEYVMTWRSALEPQSAAPMFAAWQNKLSHPYIYGLRSDGRFPASGDNFNVGLGDRTVANLALWGSLSGDLNARAFYHDRVLPGRTDTTLSLLERLLYGKVAPKTEAPVLELSRHFRNSGQVLMRDSWDYDKATVLDFKSSSLISQNHQHMDQNSFSLFYKSPLLLDSGLYELYGSTHWYNYYTRTIAHNSMVIFDEKERFFVDNAEHSNDGGQWFKPKNNRLLTYPTLEETLPGGHNSLDGVVRYENAPKYTYTLGNASRAYSSDKLDQTKGFLRSMVFLRDASPQKKPVVVMFDAVHPLKDLKANILLHTANDPVSAAASTYEGDGRYKIDYKAGDARLLTVNGNKAGMLTVQTLLPVDAEVRKVGGRDLAGKTCAQYYVDIDTKKTDLPKGASNGDCRFMVRQRVPGSESDHVWRNFTATVSEQQHRMDDVGAWRVEIQQPTEAKAGKTQYFLNVLTVGDQGGAPVKASRVKASTVNVEGVLLDDRALVVFKRDEKEAGPGQPEHLMMWSVTSATQPESMLVFGLEPNSEYTQTIQTQTGGFLYIVGRLGACKPGTSKYCTSAQGVLNIGYR